MLPLPCGSSRTPNAGDSVPCGLLCCNAQSIAGDKLSENENHEHNRMFSIRYFMERRLAHFSYIDFLVSVVVLSTIFVMDVIALFLFHRHRLVRIIILVLASRYALLASRRPYGMGEQKSAIWKLLFSISPVAATKIGRSRSDCSHR